VEIMHRNYLVILIIGLASLNTYTEAFEGKSVHKFIPILLITEYEGCCIRRFGCPF
jgi:hypothetical protein